MLTSTPALAPMTPEGSFKTGGPTSIYNWSRPHRPEAQYDSKSAPGIGVVRSGQFKLPGTIHFYETGFPSRPGMRVYLVDEDRKRTLDLRERVDPGFAWKIHFWTIPSDWVGANVRLVAEDNGTGEFDWFGITAPEAGTESILLSFFRASYVSVSLVLESLIFLLPGVAILSAMSRKREFDLIRLISVVICASGTVAYAAFWIYLIRAQLGQMFSVGVAVASIATIVLYRRFLKVSPGSREALVCLGLTLVVSVFYCSLGLLYQTDDGVGEQAQVRYNLGFMPPDNLLPAMLAEKLYNDKAPKPTLFAQWHSSDRPPLQAGITLLTFPLSPPATFIRRYYLIAIFAQCLWVPGLWVLIRSLNLRNRYLVPILGFAIFSALCSFHSFFVWPKLLSGAFAFLVFAFIMRNVWQLIDVVLASCALALGMLSHAGVAFTIIPLLILALTTRRTPNRWGVGLAVAVMLMFFLPWRWYQTSYDPPGDFLTKLSMSGLEDAKLYTQPLSTLLLKVYSGITPSQYLAAKVVDVKTLFTGSEVTGADFSDWRHALAALQVATFFHLFWSVGLLNVCFVARLFTPPTLAVRFADLTLLLVLGSVALWFLVMFAPGATVIHAWSIGNVVLIFLALVIYLVDAAPKLVYPLLALQALFIFPLYVLMKPFVQEAAGAIFDAPLDPGMAVVALCAFAAIVLLGRHAKLQEANELPA